MHFEISLKLLAVTKKDFPAGQCLRLHASTAENTGLIPGQGTKIPTCRGRVVVVVGRTSLPCLKRTPQPMPLPYVPLLPLRPQLGLVQSLHASPPPTLAPPG